MINSVKKAMEVMQLMSSFNEDGISLKYISEKTGINKSTCSHLIKTLETDGYVEQVRENRNWRIGYRTYYLTRFGKYGKGISDITHPIMKWLCRKTGQTCVLCVLRDGKRICIDYVVGQLPIESADINIEELYSAATGRILLANTSFWEQSSIIMRLGISKADDWRFDSTEEMLESLEDIRLNKYCFSSIGTEGSKRYGFAVPICKGKECIAALGLATYEPADESMISYVNKAAQEMIRRINFEG